MSNGEGDNRRMSTEEDSRLFQNAINEAYQPPARPFMGKSVADQLQEPILRYFEYEHLPSDLQMVSSRFHQLANNTIMMLPRSAERTVALRKLLEAKDAAVRAALNDR